MRSEESDLLKRAAIIQPAAGEAPPTRRQPSRFPSQGTRLMPASLCFSKSLPLSLLLLAAALLLPARRRLQQLPPRLLALAAASASVLPHRCRLLSSPSAHWLSQTDSPRADKTIHPSPLLSPSEEAPPRSCSCPSPAL